MSSGLPRCPLYNMHVECSRSTMIKYFLRRLYILYNSNVDFFNSFTNIRNPVCRNPIHHGPGYLRHMTRFDTFINNLEEEQMESDDTYYRIIYWSINKLRQIGLFDEDMIDVTAYSEIETLIGLIRSDVKTACNLFQHETDFQNPLFLRHVEKYARIFNNHMVFVNALEFVYAPLGCADIDKYVNILSEIRIVFDNLLIHLKDQDVPRVLILSKDMERYIDEDIISIVGSRYKTRSYDILYRSALGCNIYDHDRMLIIEDDYSVAAM